jgi:peptidoglycan biosynthesis protein MviN/MurJ (putative lipid II flippase)
VSLPPSPNFRTPHYSLPQNFYSLVDGRPMIMAYLACFGLLFCLLRWWNQADPLRSKRLKIWSVLVSVIMAGVIAMFLDFPQPWLPMVAGAISVSVQLSSPWAHPGKQLRAK